MSINIKKKALNVKNGDTYDNFDMFFLGDVEEAVDDWFEEHPEAVTNVADNSITDAKLAPSVREEVESVSDLKSALGNLSDSVNCSFVSFEQGAVQTSIDKLYSELKVDSTTRVRCTDLVALNPDYTYTIDCDFTLHRYSVIYFNANTVSTGSLPGGWQSSTVSITGIPYIAIAIKNADDSDIIPSNVSDFHIFENDAIVHIETRVTATEEDITSAEFTLSKIANVTQTKPDFISGVYQWDKTNSRMLWSANVKRATADLRFLEMEIGDSIGITDYTTYSIAFGDNGSWYGGGYATSDITANSGSILPYIILVKRNDDADMTATDFATLKSQFHATKNKQEINPTEEFVLSVVNQLDPSHRANNNYIHLSFDDVGYCVLNLVNNGALFNSLWDEPFFGLLKNMHDTYGAIFSLYIWNVANLANLPSKFKAEFMESSTWLKFGFHSYEEGSLSDTSYNDAKTAYETFVSNIFSKIGGVNSIDRMPRLNYFAGNVNALRGLRDANCGCIGFLNTDDTRSAYYLTQDELTYLRTHSIWSDRTNGLQFASTVMRLDWFVSGFSSQYDYNVPVEDNPYDELVYRYGQPSMADLYGGLIVFTHEWQTYTSSYTLNDSMVDRIEQVCQFANEYGYDFDYPQNRVPNITSYSVV